LTEEKQTNICKIKQLAYTKFLTIQVFLQIKYKSTFMIRQRCTAKGTGVNRICHITTKRSLKNYTQKVVFYL